MTSAVSLVLAVPLGVGAAIFLAELAPPNISSWLTFVSDLLAAVPSVIYGLLGVFLLVPLMRTTIQPFLKSGLAFCLYFCRPIRHRILDGGDRAVDYDRSIRAFGFPRGAAGGAA